MNLAFDWKRTIDLFFLDSVQRRLVPIAQLLALALLATSLAGLTWRLVPTGEESTMPLPARPAATGERPSWNIEQWHLFGQKPAGVQAGGVESLPETNLNLLLRGVFATSPDGKGGGAIIAVPNGQEDYYPLNARLPGGAVLAEVYPDRVILDRGGRLETLRLPKTVLKSSDEPTGEESGGEVSLRQYRDMLVSDPQRLADVVKISPRNEGNRFIGYEIQSGRDAALFDRLGLAPGDVVTAVNGIALDSPTKALGVLRTLAGSEDVRVDLIRNGVPETVNISLRD
jgi:general secretion pathway protein C